MRNHNWKFDKYECGEGNMCSWVPLVAAAIGAAGSYLSSKEQGKNQQEAEQLNAQATTPQFYGPGMSHVPGILGDSQDIYGNQGYAPDPNQLQLLGRENTLGYAENALPGMIGAAQNSWMQGLNGGMDPYVGSMIAAGQNDLAQNFQRNTLPYLSGQASGSGGFGGGRHQINEGLAAEGLMEAQGDLSTRLLSNAYGQRLGQQRAAWDATPGMLNTGFLPSQTQQQVGGQYQGDALNPAQNLQGYAGMVNPYLGQGSGSPVYSPQPNMTNSVLGGGMAGYGAYDAWNSSQNPSGSWQGPPPGTNPSAGQIPPGPIGQTSGQTSSFTYGLPPQQQTGAFGY